MRNLVAIDGGDYETQVEDWIVRAIRAGARTFASLLRQLPSVYPTVALMALRRLADQGRISPALAASMRRETASVPARSVDLIDDGLPLPHPLNYEWRFSEQATNDLLRLARNLNYAGDKILLFGTPRLASAAIEEALGDTILFLGENNPVTAAIRAANAARGSLIEVETCDAHRLPAGEPRW